MLEECSSDLLQAPNSNDYGQQGRQGDRADHFQQVIGLPPIQYAVAGGSWVIARDEEGGFWHWGKDLMAKTSHSRPVHVPFLKGAILLSAGRNFTSALFPDHLLVFGNNEMGQLGFSSRTDHSSECTPPTKSALYPALPQSEPKSARSSVHLS